MIWWHEHILKHTQTWSTVSVPLWDIHSRGQLVRCSCGKVWAL